jgi:hypothetical protein
MTFRDEAWRSRFLAERTPRELVHATAKATIEMVVVWPLRSLVQRAEHRMVDSAQPPVFDQVTHIPIDRRFIE